MEDLSRRAILAFGGIAGVAAVMETVPASAIAAQSDALPEGASTLSALSARLAQLPRRRRFDRVPFLVDRPELWDHEASAELLAYRGRPAQVWECTDIGSTWPALMRESISGQVFAHGHPDFLAVCAAHGSMHLALFNQATWDKYGLAERAGAAFPRNTLIVEKPGASPSDDRHDVGGFYGPGNSNIVSLQRRGAVFVACHDSIHTIARGLASKLSGGDPDAVAADLTNNLIPGAILVPSVVAYLVELQRIGFTYAKGA
jgi:intracellular sulfur oxidation DsrE/DsrF family protein